MESFYTLFGRIHELNEELKTQVGIEHADISSKSTGLSADTFDLLITDSDLKSKMKKLFLDGHHARAVEEAYKYLDNLVLRLSKQQNMTGSSLMKKVFSQKDPVLKLNEGISASEQNEQLGYMEIFSGVMTGIRNPRAHDSDWEDTEDRAFQLLVLANHLICKVRSAIGKYDHTKVEASQGTARGFFRILPHDRHEDIRFSTENRYRVMPEEITGLYPGQAIVFDASTDQIIYFN